MKIEREESRLFFPYQSQKPLLKPGNVTIDRFQPFANNLLESCKS